MNYTIIGGRKEMEQLLEELPEITKLQEISWTRWEINVPEDSKGNFLSYCENNDIEIEVT